MASVILTPDILTDSWFTDKPQRLLWWSLLVMSAATEEISVSVRGKKYKAKRGEVITTYRELAKKYKATRREIQHFIEGLIQKELIRYTSGTNEVHLIVCNYESYTLSGYTLGTEEVQKGSKGTKRVQISSSKSESKEKSRSSLGTVQKAEKDEKRKNQRKKKNKEESYALSSVRNSDAVTLSTPALETSEKEPSKPNIVTRCREIFESYFKETYNDSYYWTAKDAVATKGILQKIKFRRTDRQVPLPTDDDNMVAAFGQFIRSINKSWIINNFSLPKINSQYNDIISEIRNNRATQQQSGANIIGHQMAAVINDLAKADELYGPSKQKGSGTSQ